MRITLFVATLVLGVALGMLAVFKPPLKSQPPPTLLEVLGENTGTEFPFEQVIRETTGHRVLSPDPQNQAHTSLRNLITEAARTVSFTMSQEDSPARSKTRINEVSALFENALLSELNSHPDLTCTIPRTKAGDAQRSGYPDLRVELLSSGTVAYLDPKLFAARSINSTLRTFYFEPGGDTSKVTEDALHLLIGFPHDGKTRAWTFGNAELIDLSQLTVTLKTEFSASNKEVYALPAKAKKQGPSGTPETD
ncbi:hypothetical protein V2O64_07320 [Verrucomicrobiaceae bacterium 227]